MELMNFLTTFCSCFIVKISACTFLSSQGSHGVQTVITDEALRCGGKANYNMVRTDIRCKLKIEINIFNLPIDTY